MGMQGRTNLTELGTRQPYVFSVYRQQGYVEIGVERDLLIRESSSLLGLSDVSGPPPRAPSPWWP